MHIDSDLVKMIWGSSTLMYQNGRIHRTWEDTAHDPISLAKDGLGKKGSEWNKAGFGEGSGRGVVLLNMVKHGIGTELI